MKIIKISNGEANIKDCCSRKLRKLINQELYKGVNLSSGGEGANVSGFTMESLDKANDAAMIGMIEKLIINGEEKKLTIELLDEMDTRDYDLILEAVNKITNKEIPKV